MANTVLARNLTKSQLVHLSLKKSQINVGHAQNPYIAISRSLPILRGWTIVWIVMYHLLGNTKDYLTWPDIITSLPQGDVKNLFVSGLQLFIAAGDTGVSIFLIISGFGLTASWWKHQGRQGLGKFSLLDFWRKRVFRIFPLFWASIALSTGLYLIHPAWVPFGGGIWQQGSMAVLGAFLATITTVRNLIPGYYYFLNGAWWYVGLALQLYLIFPALIGLGQRWGWSTLLIRSLGISLIYRGICALAPLDTAWSNLAFDLFPARLFEFTFGIYIAMTVLQSADETPWKRGLGHRRLMALLFQPRFLGVNLFCFLIGLACKWSDYGILRILDDGLIAVGLFCSLVCLSQFKLLSLGPLAKMVGQYSYGIYLTHMNIYLVLWPLSLDLLPSYWPRFLWVTLGCCVIGAGFEVGYGWLQGHLRKPETA